MSGQKNFEIILNKTVENRAEVINWRFSECSSYFRLWVVYY